MEKKLKMILALLLVILSCHEVKAQLTLSEFKIDGKSSITVYTPGNAPTVKVNYTVKAKRSLNWGSEVLVSVYPIEASSGTLNLTSLQNSGSGWSTGQWVRNIDGFEYCTLAGSFNIDYFATGLGRYNKLTTLQLIPGTGTVQYRSNNVDIVFSNNLPSTAAPNLTLLSPNTGSVGTPVTIVGSGLGDATGVTFNGVAATIISGSASATNLSVDVPSGATTGNVVVTNPKGGSNGLTFTVSTGTTGTGTTGTGQSYAWLYPCGTSTIICDNQCVNYGALPGLITGRELANTAAFWDADYQGHPDFHRCFADPYKENETVDWQYSYSNRWDDWNDISGNSHGRNFQPWACYTTTYYRRKSIHTSVNMWGQTYHEEWYISNTVTITPRSTPATPVQPTYTACTQANALSVAVNNEPSAVSYNWWVPYAGWGVSNDGLSPFSTYNTNGSFVTTSKNVVITLPSGGVAPGTYPISVSTNGACGPQSSDAIINIIISGSGAGPAPSSASYVKASSPICAPKYNLKMPLVVGATSYFASDTNGASAVGTVVQNATGGQSVIFAFNEDGPVYGVIATVSATGTCGTGVYITPPADLAGPASKCVVQRSGSTTIYPNPASNKVTIVTGGQKGVVIFYDAIGAPRKSINLLGGASETEVSIDELPAGIYHVRISIADESPVEKQLIVQP